MVIKFTGCQIFGNPFFIADSYYYSDFADVFGCRIHFSILRLKVCSVSEIIF